jgi:hypothetical protein
LQFLFEQTYPEQPKQQLRAGTHSFAKWCRTLSVRFDDIFDVRHSILLAAPGSK